MWSALLCGAQTFLIFTASPSKGAFIHSPQYLRHANCPASNWGEIVGWSHGVSAGRKSLVLTGNFCDVHVHILLPFVFLSVFPGSFWPKTEMVLCALLLTCLGLKVRWVLKVHSLCGCFELSKFSSCRQEGYCTCKLHVLLLVVVSPAQQLWQLSFCSSFAANFS